MSKKYIGILLILIVLVSVFIILFVNKPSEIENVISKVNSYENSIKNKDFKTFQNLSYFPQSEKSFIDLALREFNLNLKDKSVEFLSKKEIGEMILYIFHNKSTKTINGILISTEKGTKIVNFYTQRYNDGMEKLTKEIEQKAEYDIYLYAKNFSLINSLKESSFDIEGSLTVKNLNEYEANILINGVDLGVETQSNSQNYIFSLMNKNHGFALEYGALYLSKYGSLVEGKNIIEIKYKRKENLNPGLITFQLTNSPCPFDDLLSIDLGNSQEGEIKEEFEITKTMIEKCDFKTINIKQ